MKHRWLGPGLAPWLVSGLLWAAAGLAGFAPGVLVPRPAAAAEAAPAAATASAAEAPAPVVEPPIPIPEIASRAEALSSRLRALAANAEDTAGIDAMAEALRESETMVSISAEETEGFLAEGPRLTLIDEMEIGWKEGRTLLLSRSEALTNRARATQRELEALAVTRDLWDRTGASARVQDAPASVLERIRSALAEIDSVDKKLSELGTTVLELQDEAARLLTRAEETIAVLARHRQRVVEELWRVDSPRLWAIRTDAAGLEDAWERISRDLALRLHRARRFLEWRSPVLGGQILLGISLAVVFIRARRRTARWKELDPSAADALKVLELPYSAAAVLALISTIIAHPALPRILGQLVATLALLPVVRILRPLVPKDLRWELYALACFFLIDRVREFAAAAPLVDQVLLAAEMVLGLGILGFILSRAQAPLGVAGPERSGLPRIRSLERLLFVGFAGALLACVLGYMQLARLVAGAGLASLYVAIALYAGVRALRGLLAVLLRIRPLVRLNLVQHQRALIEERLGRWIGWSSLALWLYLTLVAFSMHGVLAELLDKTLAASLSFGTVSFSLGDVVAMILTLWISILVSRLVRFVLQEDVFPRVALARGVPYALSNLIGYVIVAVGFVLALTTMGLDASRFTILAGAFGVGIGFGMQNIVNNFVSGLILLFERPIQVGDVVQIGEVLGEVKRIGIRSSTVRTFTGAEVIVPNADLIAERVTNWTLSDATRRIEIPVGVAYGTDPQRVVEVLSEVARSHKEVLSFPAPMAIFVQFGDSSIDFELRAWVADGTRWTATRTEIAVMLWHALRDAGISIPFPQREVRVLTD